MWTWLDNFLNSANSELFANNEGIAEEEALLYFNLSPDFLCFGSILNNVPQKSFALLLLILAQEI